MSDLSDLVSNRMDSDGQRWSRRTDNNVDGTEFEIINLEIIGSRITCFPGITHLHKAQSKAIQDLLFAYTRFSDEFL